MPPSFLRWVSMADGLVQKAKLGRWYISLQMRKRLLQEPDPSRHLSLRSCWRTREFSFELQRILDLHVLNEVFLTGEYALPSDDRPLCILDLGANIGASVVCFALTFPNAQIAAFEPNPECRKNLQMNTSPFGARVSIHEEAIADRNGEVTFYQNKEHWGGSLVKRAESQSFQVRTATLQTAVARLGWTTIDLVKIDIEGGEYAVATDLNRLRPERIIAEVHPDIVGTPYDAFRAHFRDYDDQALYRHGERVVIHLKRR